MNKKNYKVCFITGTRAEYGLLRNLMHKISFSENFTLQLIVTGSHLSEKHGFTIKEIIKDGFYIDSKIDIEISEDTNLSTCKSLSKLISKISDVFLEIKPDLIFLLGDRYELIGSAIAATIFRIPIAHIHGGEVTSGAFDEGIRHAITKMSHLHFVASDIYRKRVIQLGENPKNVFNVGGLGVDAIKKIDLMNKNQLEKALGIKFLKKNLLISYHPVTLSDSKYSEFEINQLLESLSKLHDTLQIFTMPNADPGHNLIFQKIDSYIKNKSNAYSFPSLGQLKYFSCLKFVDALIGNSSSGLLEAPSFNVGTINIGERQKGRLRAKSVINVEANSELILKSIYKIYSNDFKKIMKQNTNPYGNGNSTEKIIEILDSISLSSLLKKSFFDIKF